MLFLILLSQCVQALSKNSMNRKVVFIDLISSYNTFFNARNQVRFNIGREFHLTKKGFLSLSIDAGVFDKYKFDKYYDFFNSTQGYYTVSTNVLIKGIHIQPGYNYPIVQSKKHFAKGFYIGVIGDVSFYRKSKHVLNDKTLEHFYANGNQVRVNMGLSSSLRYPVYKKWHVTLQTSMNRKVLSLVTSNELETKPMNAHWVHRDNKYSWCSNLRVCYEL